MSQIKEHWLDTSGSSVSLDIVWWRMWVTDSASLGRGFFVRSGSRILRALGREFFVRTESRILRVPVVPSHRESGFFALVVF